MSMVNQLREERGLLGIAQLAAIIGSHPQTIRGWCKEGRLPHHRVGNRLKFDPVSCAEWLEARRVM